MFLFFLWILHNVVILVVGHLTFFFMLIFLFFLLYVSQHLVEQLRKENEFNFFLIFIIHRFLTNFYLVLHVVFQLVLIINYHFKKDVIGHLVVTLSWFKDSCHHIFFKVCKDLLELLQIIQLFSCHFCLNFVHFSVFPVIKLKMISKSDVD